MAAQPGFEPGKRDPKSRVLPITPPGKKFPSFKNPKSYEWVWNIGILKLFSLPTGISKFSPSIVLRTDPERSRRMDLGFMPLRPDGILWIAF